MKPIDLNCSRILCLFVALSTVRTSLAQSDESTVRLKAFEQYALTHSGDAERGRELFGREQVTKCLICHRVGERGGQVGPDLSRIGGKFDRPHLIESLLEPSRQIVEGYRPSLILLNDGRTLTGIVKERTEDQLTLLDGDAKTHTIATADVDRQVTADVSLMPTGLEKVLSPDDLTDLVAYMETLRSGSNTKNGAGITGPIRVPPGFEVSTVVTGLDGATALEAAPDGRIFLCEQTGSVRIIKGGKLLDEPFVTLPVEANWERGVIGVTLDPAFPDEPFVYVCWVAKEPYPHHRISRFRADGDVAIPGSEEVLLVGDDQTTMGGKVPSGHQGGALHFGSDGCLYVGIGEQTAGKPAQKLDTFLGKMLRIERNGSIPDDNPLKDRTTGKYQAIWAYGCRNPFTFAVRQSDGLMLINDVGGKFEEINVGAAGANFGWPAVDHGPRESDEPYAGPIHWYPQASIAGGDFAPDSFGEYSGRYFFADFVHGWIRVLDPDDPAQVVDFATGLRRPVDIRFAPDGSLYVLLRNAWVIDGKFQGGTGSLLRIAKRSNQEKLTHQRLVVGSETGTRRRRRLGRRFARLPDHDAGRHVLPGKIGSGAEQPDRPGRTGLARLSSAARQRRRRRVPRLPKRRSQAGWQLLSRNEPRDGSVNDAHRSRGTEPCDH